MTPTPDTEAMAMEAARVAFDAIWFDAAAEGTLREIRVRALSAAITAYTAEFKSPELEEYEAFKKWKAQQVAE